MKHKETTAIRTQAKQSGFREHAAPIYLTSSFTAENAEQARALFADEIEGNIYSRFSNPNTAEFAEKLAQLEKCEDAYAFSSGMAAVFGCFAALLNKGDHVVASRSLFGSSHQILTKVLPRWGINHTYVDANDPNAWQAGITSKTRMLFVETPSNPGLDIIDLSLLGRLAQAHDLILHVDNCFATPHLQTPIDFGAHLMTHSATKYIDGQGRVIGGVTAGTKALIAEIRFFARQTGPSLSPFNAWMLSKSIETLAVRMDRHCENALALATSLQGHDELEMVKYPFLPSHPQYELARKQMKQGGGIITFSVKGGYAQAQRFIDALQMISFTANLGDTRTIATHPASTTHSKLTETERNRVGIMPGLIRISVGLEHIEDIRNDIIQALERSAHVR